MMNLQLVIKMALITFCISNANAAVLSKEDALKIVNANIKAIQLPAQIVMSIMVISAGLDTAYNEDSNNPLKTMQGIMGMTCVLAKTADKAITDENCLSILHDPNKATALGIKILSEYYSECYKSESENAKNGVNLNNAAFCTLTKWYGKGNKAQQSYGLFKGLVLIFTRTVKK